MAEQGRVQVEEGVVFATGGGRELRCDVYRPPDQEGPVPGVLLLHGGGWRGGDRTQLRGYGILLGRAGYLCIASEYRLVPEGVWPAQVEDAKAAVRWMRANAGQLGLDADRIAVEGNSAGGHLALLVAGTPDRPELEGTGGNPEASSAVRAAIAVYPPSLFHYGPAQRGSVPLAAMADEPSGGLARVASPLSYVEAGFPPTLLIHGGADELVPVEASEVMYQALAAVGVPVELHIYAEQAHAFDAAPAFGRRCAEEMLFFLDRYVRHPASTLGAV